MFSPIVNTAVIGRCGNLYAIAIDLIIQEYESENITLTFPSKYKDAFKGNVFSAFYNEWSDSSYHRISLPVENGSIIIPGNRDICILKIIEWYTK